VLGLFSHFSDADDPSNAKNQVQLEFFLSQTQRFGLPGSLSNSAAILSGLATDQAWVRPGIMLYGANPFVSRSVELRPVMELTAPVIAVKRLRRGDRVGYGSRWQAQDDCTVAVLAIGYADGYPREIKSDTPVELNGQLETVLGRISMDMLTISVSGTPPSVGDRAELWGHHVAIEEVAAQAGTLSYVLMCGLGTRVPRVYQE
jgi:alanine racemase